MNTKGNVWVWVLANMAMLLVLALMSVGGYGAAFISSIHLTSGITLFVIFITEAILFLASQRMG